LGAYSNGLQGNVAIACLFTSKNIIFIQGNAAIACLFTSKNIIFIQGNAAIAW